MLSAQLLCLLLAANGAPILLKKWLADGGALAVDGGFALWDGRPLFGPSKTWRGLAGALVLTPVAAIILGFPPRIGLSIGLWAMAGDLCSSFFKRRLGVAPSGMVPLVDQIPEALFPLLAVRGEVGLGLREVMWLVVWFVVLEVLLSRVLYRLRIREQPH
jgi:CDP-2,3-bis-(O-geranylgeranyl)-sn-glycerol synthase